MPGSCPSRIESCSTRKASPISPPVRDPISFLPVKTGLYRREYESMLADVEKEIKRILNAETSYDHVLRKESQDLIAMLEKEGKNDRVEEVRKRSDAWKRGPMTPKAGSELSCWKQRRDEIKAVMNGIVATD